MFFIIICYFLILFFLFCFLSSFSVSYFFFFFFSSRRRHTSGALVTEFRRVLFRSPRPLTAPVTSATFPAILLLILCLLNSLSAQFRPASLRVLFSDAQQLGRSPDLDPSTITSW